MPERLGRYVLFDLLASGGMASVYIGRLAGPVGFSKTVAVKRLHPHLARDPDFATMFLDEARTAARILHPNVVSTTDVVAKDDELFIIMDFVRGDALARLLSAAREAAVSIPVRVAVAIIAGALRGLHAAHEAKDELGRALNLVHRDVSPHNIMVGLDGVARVIDFGIAKASSRIHATRDGTIRGKLAYMAPEQILRQDVDRRADVYAAGVVLWEVLTGSRLFTADEEAGIVHAVLNESVAPPSTRRPDIPQELDAVVLRALARDASSRFVTALELAERLESVVAPAPPSAVTELLGQLCAERLRWQAERVAHVEAAPLEGTDLPAPPSTTPNVIDTEGATNAGVVGVSQDRTAPLALTPAPSRGGRAAIAFAGVVLAGLFVALVTVAVSASKGRPATPPSSAPTVAAATLLEPIDAAASPEPPPLAPASAVATIAAPARATATPNGAKMPKPGAHRPSRRCDPPYVIDPATGVRRYKPECL